MSCNMDGTRLRRAEQPPYGSRGFKVAIGRERTVLDCMPVSSAAAAAARAMAASATATLREGAPACANSWLHHHRSLMASTKVS